MSKKRATPRGHMSLVLTDDQADAVDRYLKWLRSDMPGCSRSDAVRRLVTIGLRAEHQVKERTDGE